MLDDEMSHNAWPTSTAEYYCVNPLDNGGWGILGRYHNAYDRGEAAKPSIIIADCQRSQDALLIAHALNAHYCPAMCSGLGTYNSDIVSDHMQMLKEISNGP